MRMNFNNEANKKSKQLLLQVKEPSLEMVEELMVLYYSVLYNSCIERKTCLSSIH